MKEDIKSFPAFKEAIENNQLVYLFGTGISASLTGCAYSWWKWINDGINHITDINLQSSLRKKLNSDNSTGNLISVVGDVLKATKAENTYSAWMEESFEANDISNWNLVRTLKKLLITQDVVATTNYDLLLEKATGLETLSYSNPGKAYAMLDAKKSTAVLHIHGVYDSIHKADDIVADEKQYEAVLSNKGAQFIQNILGTRTLLFVGCGQTTEDANIAQFVQFASQHLHLDVDYYFLHKSGTAPIGMPKNIKCIPYGDDYSDLPLFLEDIVQTRIRRAIRTNGLIGRTIYDLPSLSPNSLLRYHYSQQIIPFCGRENELSALLSFVKDDRSFLWWSITGQAGSGKSRLAFELLHNLPTTWFGFFASDNTSATDIKAFIPFTNTVIIIDYVSGRERSVAELMRELRKVFAASTYALRIILIERANERITGSWYAKLTQRFSRYEDFHQFEYGTDFLYLNDLSDEAVVELISEVCSNSGLEADSIRDAALKNAYGAKHEKLQFRPLFLQLFVEAWINNGYSFPTYDGIEGLLSSLFEREQQRWLVAFESDYKVCAAFIHLILRANISGKLITTSIPDYYKADWDKVSDYISSHTFPGKNRDEESQSIISAVCQTIDGKKYAIEPMFPDIIKEYMFSYYMEEDRLNAVMAELWKNDARNCSDFIQKCLTDFPENDFYKNALNAFEQKNIDVKALLGRLELTKNKILTEKDNPDVLIRIIENEHDFWRSLEIPQDDELKEQLSAVKVAGLFGVARGYAGWSMFDVTDMVETIEEALDVEGGKETSVIKLIQLEEAITQLSQASFPDAAERLRKHAAELMSHSEFGSVNNLYRMQNLNTEMMERLLQDGDIVKANIVLKEIQNNCDYDLLESVRLLAHSCANFESFAFLFKDGKYVGNGLKIVKTLEEKYPEDWCIRARGLRCECRVAQDLFFKDKFSSEELAEKISAFENKLSTMTFGHEDSDEALDQAWGGVYTLKLNVAYNNPDALKKIVTDAKKVLSIFPRASTVLCTLIEATHTLHKRALNNLVGHEEVEELFKWLEINYDSETSREAFFEMLKDSDDSVNRQNYITKWIAYGARQDAKYNPVSAGGIDEIEEETEVLRDLATMAPQAPYRRTHRKIGPNEPCPCGSGKKFKKCCRGNGRYD